MKINTLTTSLLVISLFSVSAAGQSSAIKENRSVPTVAVRNKKGAVTGYKIALQANQLESLQKAIKKQKRPIKLENLAPIRSARSTIGYSFTVSPSDFEALIHPGSLWGATAGPPPIIGVPTVALFWQKVTTASATGGTMAFNPFRYDPNGINQSASAVCGKELGVNKVYVIGKGTDVLTINTSNDAQSVSIGTIPPVSESAGASNPAGGVLLFGGKDSAGNFVSTVYAYDAGVYTLTGSFKGFARAGAAALTTPSGKTYVFGGYDQNGLLKEAIVKNPVFPFYSKLADLPKGLRNATAIQRGQYIYIFGGEDVISAGFNNNSTVYRYDTQSNVWQTVGTLPPEALLWPGSTTFATDPNGDIHAIYPTGNGGSGANAGKVIEIGSSIMTEFTSGGAATIGWFPNPNTFTTSSGPVGPFRYNYITVSCDNIYLIGGAFGRVPFSYVNHEKMVDKYAP